MLRREVVLSSLTYKQKQQLFICLWVVLYVFAWLILIRLALGRVCKMCGDGASSPNICRVAYE